MIEDILHFSEQFLFDPSPFLDSFSFKPKSIFACGMGGSSLPYDLINDCHRGDVFLDIVRSYYLPQHVTKNDLIICSSYSGNTEETISSFKEALEENLTCIGLSSGGKIEEMCKEKGIPHIKLPIPYPNYQPRMGTGYFFGALFQVMVNHKLIPDTTSEILQDAKKMQEEMNRFEEKGKALAEKLKGKTPVIYASPKYKSVAMIWKIKIHHPLLMRA